jgi:FeS assembly protein IscX
LGASGFGFKPGDFSVIRSKETTMPDKLDWGDSENIAILLADKFPDIDPMGVRFTELHKWITELEEFGGDPKASNEGKLEAIQMAWYDEYNDRHEEAGPGF